MDGGGGDGSHKRSQGANVGNVHCGVSTAGVSVVGVPVVGGIHCEVSSIRSVHYWRCPLCDAYHTVCGT